MNLFILSPKGETRRNLLREIEKSKKLRKSKFPRVNLFTSEINTQLRVPRIFSNHQQQTFRMKLKSSHSYIIDNVVNLVWTMVTCSSTASDQSFAMCKKVRKTFYLFSQTRRRLHLLINETDSAAFESVSSNRMYARSSIYRATIFSNRTICINQDYYINFSFQDTR